MPSFFSRARDPVDSYTHFIGIALAGLGSILIAVGALVNRTPLRYALPALVFCLSMLALYTASTVYHYSNGDPARVRRLRKLDHSMIYVLIAGTYTPIFFRFQPFGRAALFIGILWGVALAGIAVKLVWITAPNWVSALVYLVMGWSILFDLSIFSRMDGGMIALLAIGGVCYTVGAVMYVLKRPNPSPRFGHHELFHIFVLLGTFFHFMAVLFYVVF
ncbi:PAQR family membrane homeostasis protein TrhA [Bittarella massiliensis (ex Durand et al. 2017)]|uniref:Hemolysin III family protein n=1 Tax=Bittarella massiliensis (ex Durand et al. 2017) TaxID=1720313 RepID=A0AAW5K9D7_9FIRM|nr:hemolysin III family protein [Bittarella massiliensis (ex Durand et al. 2017)]MCQ4949472.1 hemolysin III family protein [Bittarella massiliensis (ex Durand et al. 2017)]